MACASATVKKAMPSPLELIMLLVVPTTVYVSLPSFNLLAERQAERLVGNHLVVGLSERSPGDQRHPLAFVGWPTQSQHRDSQRLAVSLSAESCDRRILARTAHPERLAARCTRFDGTREISANGPRVLR